MTIRLCYDKFNIFDWWKENLNQKDRNQMINFLKLAQKLGFNGYCCFKVGASGCSNGMWAFKEESETGYSPDGDCIYRSFSPDHTYYSFEHNGNWFPAREEFDKIRTPKGIEKLYKEVLEAAK